MKATLRAPQILLVVAALLATTFGGYVANDQTVVGPGGPLGAMNDGQAPILQHALIALPAFLALVVLLLTRRVQQIPHPYVAASLVLFVGGLGLSVAGSAYRAVSVQVWIEWAAYAMAFLAAVSGLGRRAGPVALLGAVAFGAAWIARTGVLEYLDMRRIDPTWRIFCGWSNPNAAAAVLTLGFLCALGVPRFRERAADLLGTLGVVVGGGMILCALALTGSKGGTLLALPTGLVAFGLLAGRRHAAAYPLALVVLALSAVAFLKSIPLLGVLPALAFSVAMLLPRRLEVGRLLGAYAFGGLLLFFFASTTPGPAKAAGTTGASRIAAASSTQDQSATFRLNLWKSAVALAKERPVTGWGLGSYRYESARPGLVTATVFSHDTYLQLAAEAGLGALLVFLAFLGLWTRRALRGSSRLPEATRLPFAAAVGGLAAVLAHSLVDSDLSYFGLGLAFFLVLGAASTLATDAVAPEFVPKTSRALAAAGVAGLWALFALLGAGDLAKGQVRFSQAHREAGDLAAIESLAAWDGDAAYLLSGGSSDPEPVLRRAFDLQPTPKIARRLAKVLEARGDLAAAASALYPALTHDRNNLPTLYLLMRLQQQAGDAEAATTTARRLVAVEETPYFRIRSLDQVVPTETYLARAVVAETTKEPAAKARLLAECARGLRRYADVTVPEIVRAAKTGDRFAGEGIDEAREKTAMGAKAAVAAAGLFRSLGDTKTAAEMDDDAAALAKAAA